MPIAVSIMIAATIGAKYRGFQAGVICDAIQPNMSVKNTSMNRIRAIFAWVLARSALVNRPRIADGRADHQDRGDGGAAVHALGDLDRRAETRRRVPGRRRVQRLEDEVGNPRCEQDRGADVGVDRVADQVLADLRVR